MVYFPLQPCDGIILYFHGGLRLLGSSDPPPALAPWVTEQTIVPQCQMQSLNTSEAQVGNKIDALKDRLYKEMSFLITSDHPFLCFDF